jgi:hypothetical protein
MEVWLRDLVADEILGLNGLINLANFAFLLALSVRDVLKLRILSLAADVIVLPYYYFQHEPLWPPIFWGVAFIIVNGIRIVMLILDRRPVILSHKEEELYRVAFGSIDKRDFLKMASLARWVDLLPGEIIIRRGHHISEAIALIPARLKRVSVTRPPSRIVPDSSSEMSARIAASSVQWTWSHGEPRGLPLGIWKR